MVASVQSAWNLVRGKLKDHGSRLTCCSQMSVYSSSVSVFWIDAKLDA